jgi:titin
VTIPEGPAATFAVVPNLTDGQQYTFTVVATNLAGDSGASNSEGATPARAPAAPSLTSVSPGDGQVRLSWSAPSNDGGADVSDYLVDVYAGSGTSGTPKVIDTGSTATSAPVAGLTDGKQYTFTVQAANRAGDGAASAAASTTPAAAPGAPDLLSTSAGDRIVEIAWSPTAAANDGGAPITGYDVFRSTTAGQQGTRLATVYSGDSYIDQTVINGTTYYYEVAAVNQAGAGAPSNQMSARPQSFVPAPTLVKTTTVEGHRVSFSAPNKCIKAGEVQGRLTVSSKSSHAKKLVFRGATFTVGTLVRKTISRSKPSSSAMHVTLHVKHMAPGGSYPFVAAPSIAIGKARVHIHRLRLTITAC